MRSSNDRESATYTRSALICFVCVGICLYFDIQYLREILFSDNVLQDGDVVQSRYAVERRDRTIHERMREYLYTLKHMDEFETSILPVGDGVALSVKKGSGPAK